MPEISKSSGNGIVQTAPHEENSQELSILLHKVLGATNTPNFTKEQIDELLSQKRERTLLGKQPLLPLTNLELFYSCKGSCEISRPASDSLTANMRLPKVDSFKGRKNIWCMSQRESFVHSTT